MRYGWTSGFPIVAQIIGVIFAVLGYALFVWELISNAYLSLIVRIQKERGHTVATGGPYQFVRHPVTWEVCWRMLGHVCSVRVGHYARHRFGGFDDCADCLRGQDVAGRTRWLQEYAARVRYRLLPGVW